MKNIDIIVQRIQSGKKQIDVALKLGISPGQLSKIENGYIHCTEEMKNRILKAIDETK